MIIKFDKNLFGTEDDTAAAHFTNGGDLGGMVDSHGPTLALVTWQSH